MNSVQNGSRLNALLHFAVNGSGDGVIVVQRKQ